MAPVRHQQSPSFEVVSIKRNTASAGGSFRTLPDGTLMSTNYPMVALIFEVWPVPSREIIGMPDWAYSDRYDVIAKPPAGATRDQQNEMLRNMLTERMKLVARIEEQERDTYALIGPPASNVCRAHCD